MKWEGTVPKESERHAFRFLVVAHSVPFPLHPRLHPTPYGPVGSLHSPPTPFGREPAARME